MYFLSSSLPDGSHVVSVSYDKTVGIWNVVTWESEAELKGHSNAVYSVVFSPDGSCVVSGSYDNTVRIWNVVTGESEAELEGHLDNISKLGLSCPAPDSTGQCHSAIVKVL